MYYKSVRMDYESEVTVFYFIYTFFGGKRKKTSTKHKSSIDQHHL